MVGRRQAKTVHLVAVPYSADIPVTPGFNVEWAFTAKTTYGSPCSRLFEDRLSHVQTQAPTQSRSATRPSCRFKAQSRRQAIAALGGADSPGGRGTGCRIAGQLPGAVVCGCLEGTVRLCGPGSQVDVGDLGGPLRRNRGCKLLSPLGSCAAEAGQRSQPRVLADRRRRAPCCGKALPHRA